MGQRRIFIKEVQDMAEQGSTYVCEICGQEVRVEKSGAGKLVCCNRPMVKKEGTL